jgi:hypothetical protein
MATLYVSVPLMAYGFGRVLQVEGRSPRLLALLLVGAGGALLLIWAEFRQAAGRLGFGPGEAGFLAACLGSAAYPVLSKLGLKRGWLSPHAAARAFWSLGAGAVLIGLAGLGFEEAGALLQMTSRDALVVVYLAVFSTGLTFWLLRPDLLAAATRQWRALAGPGHCLRLPGPVRGDAVAVRHRARPDRLALAAGQPAGHHGHCAVAARRRQAAPAATGPVRRKLCPLLVLNLWSQSLCRMPIPSTSSASITSCYASATSTG